jgi:hypothetical protein
VRAIIIPINRQHWERQFTRQLQQKLGITPEQVRFHWRQYDNQRYSPESAIASLMEMQRLYPQLCILPNPLKTIA